MKKISLKCLLLNIIIILLSSYSYSFELPNVDKKALYPSITPVNTFRLIFNLYLNTSFELLPDESYAYPFIGKARHIYNFFSITDKFKQN